MRLFEQLNKHILHPVSVQRTVSLLAKWTMCQTKKEDRTNDLQRQALTCGKLILV